MAWLNSLRIIQSIPMAWPASTFEAPRKRWRVEPSEHW
jgi:hypothetical protein